MSNSIMSPQNHSDPLGRIKKFGIIAVGVLKDENPNKHNENVLTAKKSSSTTTNIDSEVPRFNDLPAHIRAKIWRMAWVTRQVTPFGSKPSPRFNICSSPQRCKRCKAENFRPRTRSPAIMYACREARTEAQKIARPLSTWLWELQLVEDLSRAWSKAQIQKFLDEACYKDEMLHTITWFKPTADHIYIDEASILRMSEQVGPPNHDEVLQAALDPALVLMLSAGLFARSEAEFEMRRSGLRCLYQRYLKPRDHIYICEGTTDFLLTDEGLQKAVQEGLFSGEDEEQRLVAASYKILFEKYEALRLYDHQHSNINTYQTLRTWRDSLNTWHSRRSETRHIRRIAQSSQTIYVPISRSQELMIKLADFLMWDLGLGFGKGLEIMDSTGHLRKDHPLVLEHGIKLPDFTPVFAYQQLKRQRPDCSAMLDRLPDMRVAMPGENLPNAMLFMLRRKRCLSSLVRRLH